VVQNDFDAVGVNAAREMSVMEERWPYGVRNSIVLRRTSKDAVKVRVDNGLIVHVRFFSLGFRLRLRLRLRRTVRRPVSLLCGSRTRWRLRLWLRRVRKLFVVNEISVVAWVDVLPSCSSFVLLGYGQSDVGSERGRVVACVYE